jgi:hypothetical protein
MIQWTALGFATNRGDVAMMRILLDCDGIDPNLKCEVFSCYVKEFFS